MTHVITARASDMPAALYLTPADKMTREAWAARPFATEADAEAYRTECAQRWPALAWKVRPENPHAAHKRAIEQRFTDQKEKAA